MCWYALPLVPKDAEGRRIERKRHEKRVQNERCPSAGAAGRADLPQDRARKGSAELIKEARGFGDLSENSEYDEAKNEQGKLYSRIAELEDILLHVVIIDESEGASNAVSIGCTVTVVDLRTGREMPPYKVVGSQEADPMHRAISEESPFGKALMGAKEGDEISVEAPVGIIHYRVEKIER